MSAVERPVVFTCAGAPTLGIVHRPVGACDRGLVVVVGGPQYRVGSHRQFLLMARALAEAGIAVFRFDCRGMGDGAGDFPGFERVGDDIRAAIDAFAADLPGLGRIALWGLCDAASAAMLYAAHDPRVAGLVLVNPWARTEAGIARAHLKHYYAQRLLSAGFWRAVARGEWRLGQSLGSFAGMVRDAAPRAAGGTADDLPERLRAALAAFAGPALFLMSGNDLTAREFDDATRAARGWRDLMARPGITRCDLPGADHTFSARADLDAATRLTRDWLQAL